MFITISALQDSELRPESLIKVIVNNIFKKLLVDNLINVIFPLNIWRCASIETGMVYLDNILYRRDIYGFTVFCIDFIKTKVSLPRIFYRQTKSVQSE